MVSTARWLRRSVILGLLGVTAAGCGDSHHGLVPISDSVVSGASVQDGNGLMAGGTYGGSDDVALFSYDPAGALRWSTQIGGPGADYCSKVELDGEGGVYVVGNSRGTIPGATGSGDGYLWKLDTAGATQWITRFGGLGDTVQDLHLQGHEAIVCGFTKIGPTGLRQSDYDGFVHRLDATGQVVASARLDSGKDDFACGLAVGADGAVYTCGASRAGLDGNAYQGGIGDGFVARLGQLR